MRLVTRRSTVLAALCLAGCLSYDALSDAESARVAVFDYYWQQLAERYPMFGGSQVSWEELRRRFRAAAPFAARPHEFYHLLTGMLSELRDPHVSFAAPPERWREDGVDVTSLLDLGGFRVMPIEGRLHVVQWPDGGEPLRPRDLPAAARYPELWRVGGFPVVCSLVWNLLLGPPGSPVDLQLRWRDGSVTRHVLHRPPRRGAPHRTLLAHLDHGGLNLSIRSEGGAMRIELASLGGELSVETFDEFVDRAAATEGLVLDLRKNLGGSMQVAERAVSRLLREPADIVFVGRDRDFRGGPFGLVHYDVFLHTTWRPREPHFDKPLVVLTSSLTASMAEHAARLLQRHGGAVIVGERTAGAEAGVVTVEGPDGGVLKFGETRVIDRTGVGLQGDGIVPDVAVSLTLADVERLGPDAAVRDWEDRLTAAADDALRRLSGTR